MRFNVFLNFFSAPLVILNTENKKSSEASEWLRGEIGECVRNNTADAGTTAEKEQRRIKAEFREKFGSDTETLPCSWDRPRYFLNVEMVMPS